jgi:hypothetical protein
MSVHSDDSYSYDCDSAVACDDYGDNYSYDCVNGYDDYEDCYDHDQEDYSRDGDGATESVSDHTMEGDEHDYVSNHDDPEDSDEEYPMFIPNPNPTPKHYPTPTVTVASNLSSIGDYDDTIAWNHVRFNVLGFTPTHHQNILELFSKHGINDTTSLLMLHQHELYSMSHKMRKVEHFICYAEALFGPEECILHPQENG